MGAMAGELIQQKHFIDSIVLDCVMKMQEVAMTKALATVWLADY